MVFSTFKTAGADLAVQIIHEGKSFQDVDWRRNCTFGAFGCFYLGGFQYVLFVKVFTKLFPRACTFAAKSPRQKWNDPHFCSNMGDVMKQTFLALGLHVPLVYFPAFYISKEFITNSKSPSISTALCSYKENARADLNAYYPLWLPATILNFTFMPMHARIPFIGIVSVGWTCILSVLRGSGNDTALELNAKTMDMPVVCEHLVANVPPLHSSPEAARVFTSSNLERARLTSAVLEQQ
jgi:hypothetical protein